MTKSELIGKMIQDRPDFSPIDIENAVRVILEQMSVSLESGERVEIRGFGSFSLHYRVPRIGRNPKTGEEVELQGRSVPHFKPGRELREQVNSKR